MGEFKDREKVRESTAADTNPPRPLKATAEAVQTPPPESAAGYDPEAATILDASGGFEAATQIETPAPHDAPTVRDARPTARPFTASSQATQAPRSNWNAPLLLPTGAVLANRYEILQLLGEGGMGAVYKARDTELDRVIALKVIRPELASNPEILQRFKQELVLARQVTDRNIIRIFDLGEADGIRFITMEFVEGTSLYQILREQGKLPVKDAAEIISQVLTGLKAAHREGVIHRDLKPGNIMRDPHGRILVMDFGLARSLQSDGMTKTGAVLGTMEYMSPEQAMGSELDPRSDLFTVGLIFFELLTAKMPFKAETALASLLKRVQERAVVLSSLDNTIPIPVERIVAKCLERDVNQRYQTAQEMIDDLHNFLGHGPAHGAATTLHFPPVRSWGRKLPWKWGSAAVVVVLVFAGVMLRGKFTSGPTAANKSVSVLVADFTNHTGDPIFDDTLEPMFNVALEGASFINAYSRGTARNLAKQLPHPSDKLDEESARLIGVSQGLAAVVTGSLTLRGDAYKLSVEALDGRTGNSIATADITARNKDELLIDIPKLAAPIRKALGDTTPVSAQLAVSGPFTAASLEVVHLYSVAMQQQFAGKTAEAFQSFSKAAELDPNFARAYSGMSGTSYDLGRQTDGEKYIKLAMEHLDRMTERERYHTRGYYYLVSGNYPKCIEEYGVLVSQYAADRVGLSDLAWCYAALRNFPKALEAARKAEEIAPKGAVEHQNLAFYSSFAGDFQTGEREARTALEISLGEVAQLNLGEAQMGEGKLADAMDTYHGLERLGPRGASLAASALADLAMYQGRLSEEVRLLQQGAEADLKAKMPENATSKFAALAYAELLRGETKAAIASGKKALATGQTIQVRFLAGRVFAEAGETAQAKKMADALAQETQSEPQAYGKIIEGKLALKQGNSALAVKDITDANNVLDTWIGRFELGRVYLQAGQFTEADSEFDRCIKRKGEALELFVDNTPTYGYVPYVYYYQGRVRQGLKTPAFADSYRTYLSIRGQSSEDPLVAEVRKSLGQ
jgi:tetratricopeptide (TPR) repeat protein